MGDHVFEGRYHLADLRLTMLGLTQLGTESSPIQMISNGTLHRTIPFFLFFFLYYKFRMIIHNISVFHCRYILYSEGTPTRPPAIDGPNAF